MLPPGLAMIGLSNAAIEKIGEGKDYYFNLATEIKKQQRKYDGLDCCNDSHHRYNAIFDEIEEEGI